MNIYLVKPIGTPTQNMVCMAKDMGQAILMHPENKWGSFESMEAIVLGIAAVNYTKPMMISYQKD